MTAGRPFPEVDSTRFVLVPVKERRLDELALIALAIITIGAVLWAFSAMRPLNNSFDGIGSGGTSDHSSAILAGSNATLAAIEATRLATETMPTATSTATATPVPTATQRAVWQPDPCSTPEPGQLCRVPDRAPPTPTPYPSCYDDPEPGKWCRWWLMDDAPDGRSETR